LTAGSIFLGCGCATGVEDELDALRTEGGGGPFFGESWTTRTGSLELELSVTLYISGCDGSTGVFFSSCPGGLAGGRLTSYLVTFAPGGGVILVPGGGVTVAFPGGSTIPYPGGGGVIGFPGGGIYGDASITSTFAPGGIAGGGPGLACAGRLICCGAGLGLAFGGLGYSYLGPLDAPLSYHSSNLARNSSSYTVSEIGFKLLKISFCNGPANLI
jgi:hypothetical protein